MQSSGLVPDLQSQLGAVTILLLALGAGGVNPKKPQNHDPGRAVEVSVCHGPVLINPRLRQADESRFLLQYLGFYWRITVKRNKNFFFLTSYLGSGVILKCCWKWNHV